MFVVMGLYEILIKEFTDEDKLEALGISDKTLLEKGATENGVDVIINSVNNFAFDLYRKIVNETDENVILSPFSLYITLSMIYEGAQEDTADEMANILHFPADDGLRQGSFAKLQNDINNRKSKSTLKLSNNVWIQDGLSIKDGFRNNIDNYYFANIEELDFMDNPEGSRETINQWVDKETEGKIKEILPKGSIDKATMIALTNAIYFKGDWKYKFNKENTRDSEFYLENNQTKTVPMMNIDYNDYDDIEFNMFRNKTIQVLELPYIGDTISMMIFLPIDMNNKDYQVNPRSIYELDNELNSVLYQEVIEKFNPVEYFYISLPRFSFESDFDMKNNLKPLGIEKAFDPSANFNGITDNTQFWIDEVYHKASITVNEKGTEAAAASSAIGIAGFPPEFIADHPFFFTIQDKETGLILFMGRVMDPGEQ